MNNLDSLRAQIIESMKVYCYKYKFYTLNEQMMFDGAIMPVLDAAMKAGELLVHRATTPQKPVSDAILEWLDGCCSVVAKMRAQEATVSKRELLRVLYQLDEGAGAAAAEARSLVRKTTGGATGNPLAGLNIPKKG